MSAASRMLLEGRTGSWRLCWRQPKKECHPDGGSQMQGAALGRRPPAEGKMCVQTRMCLRACMRMFVCMLVRTWAFVCICACLCVCECMCKRTRVQINKCAPFLRLTPSIADKTQTWAIPRALNYQQAINLKQVAKVPPVTIYKQALTLKRAPLSDSTTIRFFTTIRLFTTIQLFCQGLYLKSNIRPSALCPLPHSGQHIASSEVKRGGPKRGCHRQAVGHAVHSPDLRKQHMCKNLTAHGHATKLALHMCRLSHTALAMSGFCSLVAWFGRVRSLIHTEIAAARSCKSSAAQAVAAPQVWLGLTTSQLVFHTGSLKGSRLYLNEGN